MILIDENKLDKGLLVDILLSLGYDIIEKGYSEEDIEAFIAEMMYFKPNRTEEDNNRTRERLRAERFIDRDAMISKYIPKVKGTDDILFLDEGRTLLVRKELIQSVAPEDK